MKNEDRIVELLAESLQRFDRMAERLNVMSEQQTVIIDRLEQLQHVTSDRFGKVEQAITSLATGINEFVNIHRETVKAQNDRIGNLERRVDRLEGRS
jgi:DNA-binding ferritin-like protein